MSLLKSCICFFCFLIVSFKASSMEDYPTSSIPSLKKPFDFSTLFHEAGDPDTYTLIGLDLSLIPTPKKAKDLQTRTEFNPIKHWIKKELLESIDKGDLEKNLTLQDKDFEGTPYYLVQLSINSRTSPAERLTHRIATSRSSEQIENTIYRASAFIFPQINSNHALIYLLGEWKQFLNPYAIIPNWGLRLAASKDIYSDKTKTLTGKSNLDPNPTSRKEKKQRLASTENFNLQVGTEGLKAIEFLPRYAFESQCQRIVVASDSYKFPLPVAESGDQGNTMGALIAMAKYLYDTHQTNLTIHPKLNHYLDSQVSDLATIKALNTLLLILLKSSPKSETQVFPSDTIWKYYGNSLIFSYGKNKQLKSLLDVLENEDFTLDSPISIKKTRDKSKGGNEEPLSHLIYSLPLEYKEAFYRFDRGQWFKVASSKFDPIIEKLRDPGIKTTLKALIPYTLDDALTTQNEEFDEKNGEIEDNEENESKTKKKREEQEKRYNLRVVSQLNDPKLQGILIDCINVHFSGKGHQFEFGDILLYDDAGNFYIVHVKRRGARDFDHHCSQVQRCAEYLATELKKKKAQKVLINGCVNGLYLEHGIPTEQTKRTLLKLVSNVFKEDFKKKKSTKTWKQYLANDIMMIAPEEQNTPLGKLKEVLQKIDLYFFKDHKDELIMALDALNTCILKSKAALETEKIEKFIKSMEQIINVRSLLLSDGVLSEEVRKKITIVMAVIDDRSIAKAVKDAKKVLKNTTPKKKKLDPIQVKSKATANLLKSKRDKEIEVFLKQELWGLDHTSRLVQKYGFNFNLVVVNENQEREDWDAFGPTILDRKKIQKNRGKPDIEEKSPKRKKQKRTEKNTDTIVHSTNLMETDAETSDAPATMDISTMSDTLTAMSNTRDE